MKKYLGLFVVLLVVGFVGVKIAGAENSNGEVPPTPPIIGNTNSPTKPLVRPKLEDGSKIKELRKAMEDKKDSIKADFEAKREEMKTKIEALREEAKTKMEGLKNTIKSEKDAMKAKIKGLRIDSREKALQRFDGAIARVSEMKDKVNGQIAKFEAKGVDTTSAKAFVATAETKLDEAKAKTAEANTLLSKSIDQITTEDKTKLKTLAQETQTLIKEAHKALQGAVKSLKDAVKIKREAVKTEDTTKIEDTKKVETEVNN